MSSTATNMRVVAFSIALSLQLFVPARAEDQIDEVNALLGKLRDARLVFERYIVTCIVKSSDYPEYPEGLKITYQISIPDEHRVLIFDYSDCKNADKSPSKWIGRSGKHFVSGKVGDVSRLADWPEKFDPLKSVRHFDIMGVGFGFLGELKLGTPFTTIMEYYAKYPALRVANDGGFTLLTSSDGRPRIVIDTDRNSWPIKSVLDHALWSIELKRVEDLHVPIAFEFTELDNRKLPAGELAVELEWESINKPFPVGKDAASAIAARFGCKFEM